MIVYKGRLLKKSSLANQKLKLIQSTLVTTWLSNIAFHLLPIWLQTLAEINSESCQRFKVFARHHPKSLCCSIWIHDLSRHPFLWQVAFHWLPIWLQTLVAIDSESCLTLFPRFCAPPSEVAVLFYSNLSRLPFLGQVVNLDLLLCTGFDSEHVVLFLYHIFAQRPMNDSKIDSDWAKQWALLSCCFGRQQLPANSNGNSISKERKICRHCQCPISTKH